MKRAVVLVMALGLIGVGAFMDTPHAFAENISGDHFVKGKIVAVESCYNSATKVSSTCLGVVESNDRRHAGKITGDVRIGRAVYLECETANGFTECSKDWGTSVGERYLHGGEITQ
jgi:hypothetical protein